MAALATALKLDDNRLLPQVQGFLKNYAAQEEFSQFQSPSKNFPFSGPHCSGITMRYGIENGKAGCLFGIF